jgi:hypothetical protein
MKYFETLTGFKKTIKIMYRHNNNVLAKRIYKTYKKRGGKLKYKQILGK